MKRPLERAMPWLVVAAVLGLWQAAVVLFRIQQFVLPSPVAIGLAFLQYHAVILADALYTLVNTLIGFVMGVVGGLALGILIGSSRLAYHGLYPLLIGFNAVPKVAITPVFVLWLGIGQAPAVLTAFLLCFFPVAVNIATGLATLEPELEDLLRSLGAGRLDILRKVGLPRSMPYLFASLKIAITLAFVGAVIAETIAGNDGIGFLMLQAAAQFRVPLMFAGLAVIALMGTATYGIFALLERRFAGWSMRRNELELQGSGG
jgi:NitT/TauT family transport system permease protein